MSTRLTIRLDFEFSRRLGAGKIALLESIDKTGSIAAGGRDRSGLVDRFQERDLACAEAPTELEIEPDRQPCRHRSSLFATAARVSQRGFSVRVGELPVELARAVEEWT